AEIGSLPRPDLSGSNVSLGSLYPHLYPKIVIVCFRHIQEFHSPIAHLGNGLDDIVRGQGHMLHPRCRYKNQRCSSIWDFFFRSAVSLMGNLTRPLPLLITLLIRAVYSVAISSSTKETIWAKLITS